MRRLASLTTVFVLVLGGMITGLASAASGALAHITPGSVWTIQTPTTCESDTFAITHTFSTALDYGNGDAGKYHFHGTKGLKMTWTAGTAKGEVFSGTWSKATGVYSGTYSHAGAAVSATVSSAASVGCAVVKTAPASASIVLGTTDTDTATVTGVHGIVPTGTVSFYVCGPDTTATACTTTAGTPLGAPATLSASGSSPAAGATASSVPFTPASTGTYCFLGVYSGDAIYPGGGVYASSTDGSTTDECFTVTSAGSGVTTAPLSSSIVLGSSDTDTATITGVGATAPTGTVSFSVCGPEPAVAACAAPTPAGGSSTPLGSPVTVVPGSGATSSATSADFTPTTVGTYCFLGVYSGDANFDGASDGSATDECFTVTQATPAVTSSPFEASIALGGTDSDAVTVTGTDGITPTGTVTFWVCPGDTTPCTSSSSGAVDLVTNPVSDGEDQNAAAVGAYSDHYTPPSAGTYCFSAVYSGDDNYTSASDATSDECFDVTSTTASPMALGSPENSFGTGPLSLGAGSPTNIWAAVNGYCTSKENGDEFLSAFDATWTGDGWNCSAAQTGETPNATTNYEYNGDAGNAAGYSYDIVTPPSVSDVTDSPITVQAYDPAYEPTQCAGQTSGTFNPAGGQTPDISAGGTGTSITTAYSLTYAAVPGNDADDTSVAGLVVGPTSGSTTQADQYVAESADPATCGQWATLFTIPAGSPDGYYRVEVSTPQSPGQNSDGVNAYALRDYQGDSFARCSTVSSDAWYSSDCPLISGQTALSTYVNQPGSTGSFYLAQVPASYAGSVMDVNLFDPGEGDKDIALIDPDGNAVPFTWQTTDGCPLPAPNAASTDCAQDLGLSALSGSGSALDVSGTINPPPGEESNSEFNDREVQLAVSVPADYTADNGGWWQIKYTSTNGTVQDRITWSVVLGATPPAGGTNPVVSARRGRTHRASTEVTASRRSRTLSRHDRKTGQTFRAT
jgi:hypothetical protein